MSVSKSGPKSRVLELTQLRVRSWSIYQSSFIGDWTCLCRGKHHWTIAGLYATPLNVLTLSRYTIQNRSII